MNDPTLFQRQPAEPHPKPRHVRPVADVWVTFRRLRDGSGRFVVPKCPFCGEQHIHGASEPGEDPRAGLDQTPRRLSHCAEVGQHGTYTLRWDGRITSGKFDHRAFTFYQLVQNGKTTVQRTTWFPEVGDNSATFISAYSHSESLLLVTEDLADRYRQCARIWLDELKIRVHGADETALQQVRELIVRLHGADVVVFYDGREFEVCAISPEFDRLSALEDTAVRATRVIKRLASGLDRVDLGSMSDPLGLTRATGSWNPSSGRWKVAFEPAELKKLTLDRIDSLARGEERIVKRRKTRPLATMTAPAPEPKGEI